MQEQKTFREVVEKTCELVKEFEKYEQKKWGVEGAMIELMKQVGDLSRAVMMKEKYYIPGVAMNPKYKSIDENISDELYDIFTMTVRIANHYGVDLERECEKEYVYSMNKLNEMKKE
jgi:NTP pyrophosphatase (non-canonical NTP hydrolase)